jgi:hypothetical protein
LSLIAADLVHRVGSLDYGTIYDNGVVDAAHGVLLQLG